MSNNEELLTPQEAATELRVSKHSVLYWIRTEKLPALNLGHKTKRIRRSDFDAFKASRESGAC